MNALSRYLIVSLALLPFTATAEVVSSSEQHFVLRHTAESERSAEEMWRRLLAPASWWHPEHTYSGDAGNLSLDARAGGLWKEEWSGGSVLHGRVLTVESGRLLRMEAPFGPLQALGAYTVWTITIEADGAGSIVTFDEVSSGPPTADMAQTAIAVDFVKGEAISRLVGE